MITCKPSDSLRSSFSAGHVLRAEGVGVGWGQDMTLHLGLC